MHQYRGLIIFTAVSFAMPVLMFGGPFIGIPALLTYFLYFVPRFWRWTTNHNTDVLLKRRKQAIENQVTWGRLDVGLQREVVEEMRRDGRL